MKNRLIFLGTGGSVGVPMIGCTCPICLSEDSKNKRLRPSVLLKLGQKQFLIDVGPDFRFQALRLGITMLDGLLLTHAHHDHTAGLDDLRPIYHRRKAPLPILLSEKTAEDLKMRFYYLFQNPNDPEQFKSHFDLHLLSKQNGEEYFQGFIFHYVTYTQGGMPVNGFRIGDLAYLSDIRQYDASIFEQLKGVRYLIISSLRYTPSPLHFSVDEAIDFAKELQVEFVWLTHLSHDLEYHQTNAYLPANVRLAYDGLEIEFE